MIVACGNDILSVSLWTHFHSRKGIGKFACICWEQIESMIQHWCCQKHVSVIYVWSTHLDIDILNVSYIILPVSIHYVVISWLYCWCIVLESPGALPIHNIASSNQNSVSTCFSTVSTISIYCSISNRTIIVVSRVHCNWYLGIVLIIIELLPST